MKTHGTNLYGKCSLCLKRIKINAIKCPHCRANLKNHYRGGCIAIILLIFGGSTYLGNTNDESYNAKPWRRSEMTQVVVVRDCNIRKGPGTETPKVSEISALTSVKVIEDWRGWYRIKTSNGTEGWIGPACIK